MRDARRVRGRSAAEPDGNSGPVPQVPAEPAPEALLLGDERVALARMASVRAGLALDLQRGGGNAAVGRILARETAAPAKPALRTGKELDSMLLANSFLAPYIRPKIKQGIKAEGHIHIHDPDTFKAEVLKYLRGKDNPKTGEEFTDPEAERFEKTVKGFQDDAGEIRIHETRGTDGTVVHEGMHLFSANAFVDAVGYHVNEGATEVFARRITSEHGITHASYPTQHRLVMQIVTLLGGAAGEKLLTDAYFKNELEPLEQALDKKAGAGTWDGWLALMQAGKFEEADALF